MRTTLKFYLFCMTMLCVLSCKMIPSETEITNGVNVDGSYPFVLQIQTLWNNNVGRCTATVLSHNTLLTAAHCINQVPDKDSRIVINAILPDGKVVQNKTYGYHAKYKSETNGINFDAAMYDIGVVIFEDHTFDGIPFVIIHNQTPKTGNEVGFMGFGCKTTSKEEFISQNEKKRIVTCIDHAGKLPKRLGLNTVVDADTRCAKGMIQIKQREAKVDSDISSPTGMDAMLAAGDSGGPLFEINSDHKTFERAMVGISAYVDTTYNNAMACFTNLTNSENLRFLQEVQKKLKATIYYKK